MRTVGGRAVSYGTGSPSRAGPHRRQPARRRAALPKVAVTVENTTAWTGTGGHRDDAMGHSLIAVHTMLAVDDGTFVSLLDPPDDAAAAAATCRSDGAYPVLIGDGDVVLASPIILYDHPEVAPQSPGDLYDSLEIDEILALRVMTLTDQEKSEARGTDPRAAAIIDRCDDMSAETLGQLHGADAARSRPRAVGAISPIEPARRGPVVGPRSRRLLRSLDRVGLGGRRRDHQGQRRAAATFAPGRRPRHLPRRHGGHGGRRVHRRRR